MGWITITSTDPERTKRLQALLDEGKTQADLDLEAKQGRESAQTIGDWDAKHGEDNK